MLTAQVFGSANSAVAWTVNAFTNGTGTSARFASSPASPASR